MTVNNTVVARRRPCADVAIPERPETSPVRHGVATPSHWRRLAMTVNNTVIARRRPCADVAIPERPETSPVRHGVATPSHWRRLAMTVRLPRDDNEVFR